MRVVHLTPSVGPESYGLGQVALNLAKAQIEAGLDPVIWCLDSPALCREITTRLGCPAGMVRGFAPVGPRFLGYSPAMLRAADEEGNRFRVAHQHGIWTGMSRVTNRLRQRHHVPGVVAPHGSLEPRVVVKSGLKKRLALLGYESKNLKHAACLHATAPGEVSDFRQFGLSNPIAHIPNGISSEWARSVGDAAAFRREFRVPEGKRVLLFMARIAPKKGLPLLLHAFKALQPTVPDWVLVIVGSDEDGHLAEVTALVAALGLESSVIFTGAIFGAHKRNAFEAAELFVLPSLSEGFPMVVLDALGAGVPSIVTQACEWEVIATQGCGWWVEASVDAIGVALAEGLSRTPGQLTAMGRVARELVVANYAWLGIAKKTSALYRWMVKAADRPEFMHLASRTHPLAMRSGA